MTKEQIKGYVKRDSPRELDEHGRIKFYKFTAGIDIPAVLLIGDGSSSLLERIPKWISVEDRLPDEGSHVLAWGKDWIRTGEMYYGETEDDDTCAWRFHDEVDVIAHKSRPVTHWMPLPPQPDNLKP